MTEATCQDEVGTQRVQEYPQVILINSIKKGGQNVTNTLSLVSVESGSLGVFRVTQFRGKSGVYCKDSFKVYFLGQLGADDNINIGH